jgi:hypothetical protein
MTITLGEVIMYGTHANRPTDNAAGTAGRLYYETDTGKLFRDNGSTWDSISSTGANVLEMQVFS